VRFAGRKLSLIRAPLPRRAWVIRSLVLASIALLVAGAVAPLLTTERFHFISNTFSLASGLIQLAARQQYLVAVLIVVFSFCVPIAKAVVTWRAVSDREASRPLFTLADRFGKWSMLEVFVRCITVSGCSRHQSCCRGLRRS
jgi:uncharacterized paraquat-inducible protein A